MLEKIIEAAFFAVFSIALIFSTLFGRPVNADALSNPLAGKPWSFDDMLPYLNEKQLIYRGGTGDNGDNPLGIIIEPSDDNEDISEEMDQMTIGDIIASD